MKKFTFLWRLMMVMLLPAFIAFEAPAQNMIEIGTGTYTSSLYPAYGYYNYSWSKSIYLDDFLGTTGFQITKLGWKYYSSSTSNQPYTMLNQEIWVTEVSYDTWPSSSTWPDPANNGWTLVYSGTITLPYTTSSSPLWLEVPLSTVFTYSGTQNLAICWLNRDGSYASGYPYWYYTTAASYTTYYAYSDASLPTTGGSSSSARPNLRVYYQYPPYEATVTGLVTDAVTSSPIIGALITASTVFGDYYTYSAFDGTYTLPVEVNNQEQYATITCDKPGYATATQVVAVPPEGVAVNFVLGEDLVPPSGVFAVKRIVTDAEVVDITWGIPNGYYEIIYDDDMIDNMTAWTEEGSYNALRFTPVAYPVKLIRGSVNIGNGFYPPGGDILQPFHIAIFDDDGPNHFPGTELAYFEVVPENFGWVGFDLSRFDIVLGSGDFYIAMQQGGNYPNCAPIAIDNTNPVYRSYSKYDDQAWLPSVYNDFMMRAVCQGPGGGGGTLAARGEYIPEQRQYDQQRAMKAPRISGGYMGEAIYMPLESGEAPRDLLHYSIYRINEGDEGNPANWTLLLGNIPTTVTMYTDNGFNSVPNGGYRWGVTATYSSGVSAAGISNLIGKNWESDVTFNVSLSSGLPPTGAYLTLINQDGLPDHSYSAVVDETGVVNFPVVWNGTYDLTVTLLSYDTYQMLGFVINGNVSYDVVLQETKVPPTNLYVDPLTLAATWNAPTGYAQYFMETFTDLSGFAANGWTLDPTSSNNWAWYSSDGHPAPCARYYYSPSWTNYSQSLVSKSFDFGTVSQLYAQYDVYLNNYSATGQEHLSVEVWDGSQWEIIDDFANTTSFGFNTYTRDVSAFTNGDFKIRFRAWGANSFNINWWYVDNIRFYSDFPKNVIGYNVYLDQAISGFTSETNWQYNPANINWGQTYMASVQAYYASGWSDPVYYAFTSVYLPPPINLQGEDVGHTAHLTWERPGGGGGGVEVTYIEDDGTYENGWYINPGAEAWLGNGYNVSDVGEIIQCQIYFYQTTVQYSHTLTIDFMDPSGTLLGTSDAFVSDINQWIPVNVPNVPFNGYFYALVHYNALPTADNWFAEDNSQIYGNFAVYHDPGLGYYFYLLSNLGYPGGAFLLRVTATIQTAPHAITYGPPLESAQHEGALPTQLLSERKIGDELVSHDAGQYRSPVFGPLTNYLIYRDGVQIASVDSTIFEYYDEGLDAGYYDYYVTAQYDAPTPGESMPSNDTLLYISGEGNITGTVSQYGDIFYPIEGATVTATGQWGTWSTVTASNGSYTLNDVVEGTYTMTCEADGFETIIRDGVYVGFQQTVTENFEMYEFPYAPLGVTATLNATKTQVTVNWYDYASFYLIKYDDGIADNVTCWIEPGNINALKFTPVSYPAQLMIAQINIYDGTWPPGNILTPFDVAVYKDNGPGGLPGTQLGQIRVTPFDYNWVEVNLADLNIMIQSGSFYIGMIQGGSYPDCAPIAIDESNPVYRSYSLNRTGGGSWEPAAYADFMMRAYMYSETDGLNVLDYTSEATKVTIKPPTVKTYSLIPPHLKPGIYEEGQGVVMPVGEDMSNRDVTGYDVYLLEQGDEENPDLWTLKGDNVQQTNYLDVDWDSYAQGWYRYAVRTLYTYNQSAPAFSNVLPNKFEHTVTINVRCQDGSPAAGAKVVLVRNDEAYTYTATVPDNGIVIFYKEVWEGTYNLSVTKPYYSPYALNGIPIFNDRTIVVNLVEMLLPPRNFFVDNVTGVATWDDPYYEIWTGLDEDFNDGLPGNWTVVNGGVCPATWQWVTSDAGATLDGTPFMFVDSDGAGSSCGVMDEELISPEFDGTGQPILLLEFDQFYQALGDIADVDVWDGNGWVNVLHQILTAGAYGNPDHPVIDITVYKNKHMKVRFHYYNADWAWWWAVDNVKVWTGSGRSRTLLSYNVYLDGILLANTTLKTYTFTDLVIGQFYIGGVQAVYSSGVSPLVEFPFTYYTCDYFPQPENLQGTVECNTVNLTWEMPGGGTFVYYQLDDNTWENGVRINPGYDAWLGNLFDVSATGEIAAVEVYFIDNGTGSPQSLTVDIMDESGTVLGSSEPFVCALETWQLIDLPYVPFSGQFYAMVHWAAISGNSYYLALDQDASPNVAYEYYAGSFSAPYPGAYFLRVIAQLASGPGVVVYGSGPDFPMGLGDNATLSLCNTSGTANPNSTMTIQGNSGSRDFVLHGYNVFRDGVKINSVLLNKFQTTYTDIASPGGIYSYNVAAIYDMGYSCPLDPPFVAVVGADLNPPENLSASVTPANDVWLTWNSPSPGRWIHWDDGEYDSRLGLTDVTEPVTWAAAARFEPADLSNYDGFYITKIRFVPAELESISSYTIKVWTGPNAANEVVSQPVSGLTISDWNTITLTTPYMIDASQELWFGLEFTQVADGYPGALDAVTDHDGKGNMIYYEGAWYALLSDFGFEGDWNVQAYVMPEVDNYTPVVPIARAEYTNSGNEVLKSVKAEHSAVVFNEDNRGLDGYNVWRNGDNIAFVAAPDTTYLDPLPEPATYDYYVSAIYDGCESFPDGPASVTIIGKGTLKGYVYDYVTGAPIENALITVPGGYSATTGFDGQYIIMQIPVGVYDVTCHAEGYKDKIANNVQIVNQGVTIHDFGMLNDSVFSMPFFEPWDGGSFDDQNWTFPDGMGNWLIQNFSGNPAPTAEFNWSPTVTNYSFALVSPEIDATEAMNNVTLSFDLYLSDYGSTGQEYLTVDAWNGTTWVNVDEFVNNGSIDWTSKSYNITNIGLGHLTKVRFVAHGTDSYEINWWDVDNIKVYEQILATLQGTVTDLAYGYPIEGAKITVGENNSVFTNADGFYSITVEEGTYPVTCEATGYCTVDDQLMITGTVVWDVAMGNPIMTIDPLGLDQFLEVGNNTATQVITITNDGNCPLHWSGIITLLDKSATPDMQLTTVDRTDDDQHDPSVELSPRVTMPSGNETDDVWDVQYYYSVSTSSGTMGQAGAEFDGTYFYTTVWSSNTILKYDHDGNYIGTYTISGASQIRDLAYDGTYLYGGSGSTMIYEIDPATISVLGQIASPGNVRAIAYDPTYDGFWICDWATDIYLVGRDGSMIDVISNPGLSSMYGLAYDDVTGPPSLWIFDQGGSGAVLYQLDIGSGTLTGVTHDVLSDISVYNGIAGGLFLSTAYMPGTITLGGLIQGDLEDVVFGYELGTYNLWISIDPHQGNIEPGSSQEIMATFDATDLVIGDYFANITFVSAPDVGTIVVPVHLGVGVGIEEPFNAGMINIYPNPANEQVNVVVNAEVREVRMLNYIGQEVLNMNVVKEKTFQINTSHMSVGTYMLEFIATDGSIVTKRLVISR
jgi:hypothetical protein